MLEDLDAIQSRMRNGYKYYTLAPSRTLWYLKRSLDREEPQAPVSRAPVRYDSALEHVRRTMPRVSEFEAMLRRGC